MFCGVPSKILGTTKISPPGSSTSPGGVDCVFMSSLAVWKTQLSGAAVYVPIRPESVRAQFPDWTHTGRKILNFFEYVRKVHCSETEVMVACKPHVRFGGSIRLPVRLFPYVDATLLHNVICEGDPEPPYQLVVPVLQGKYLLLRPHTTSFNSWRKMMWVGKQGYGSYLTSPSFDLGMGCVLQAAFPLPWDMSASEIRKIEEARVSDHQELLRALYRKKEKIFPRTARFISANGFPTLAALLQNQKEFSYQEYSETHIKLKRNWDAHPAFSENVYIREYWQKLLKEKDKEKAFISYKRFVVDLDDRGFYT